MYRNVPECTTIYLGFISHRLEQFGGHNLDSATCFRHYNLACVVFVGIQLRAQQFNSQLPAPLNPSVLVHKIRPIRLESESGRFLIVGGLGFHTVFNIRTLILRRNVSNSKFSDHVCNWGHTVTERVYPFYLPFCSCYTDLFKGVLLPIFSLAS